MPQALAMQEKYGDDVQFLFIESQGATPEEAEKFVLQKKWLSDYAIWTNEAPFSSGSGGLPSCVVLGIDGTVLINGNPMSAHSAIEEALEAQIKLAKKGPKELAAPLAKSWQDFEKGLYSASIASLKELPEGPDKKEADKLATNLETRAKAMVNRLAWLIDSAEFEQADKLSAKLSKGLAGHALEEKVKELAGSLTAKEMAPEREAAKALEKVEKRIVKDGIDAAVLKQLKSVSEKFGQTRAGKRAAHMASMLGA